MNADAARQDQLIKRIRKLLALSRNNSNPHEAGQALSRAQALMRKHGITELDTDISVIKTSSSKGAPSEAEKVPVWMGRLMHVVAEAFGCHTYLDWRITTGGYWRRVVIFYGFGERPVVAAYAFDVLCRQMQKATKAYLSTQSRILKLSTRRARAAMFRDGWVYGVRDVVDAFPLTEDETRVMKTWLKRQQFEGMAAFRNVKDCNGGDRARWQGYSEGTRKSNASSYLPTIFALSAAGAAGDALSEGQYTSQNNVNGITSTLTGSAGQAALGKALSGGMNETADWVRQRYGQTFDAIYVPPGKALAVHITRQLAIDYEEQGRRVRYDFALPGEANDHGGLD